jgi:hypothetical protein
MILCMLVGSDLLLAGGKKEKIRTLKLGREDMAFQRGLIRATKKMSQTPLGGDLASQEIGARMENQALEQEVMSKEPFLVEKGVISPVRTM